MLVDCDNTSCSHKRWKTTARGFFVVIVVVTSASSGVLYMATAHVRDRETAVTIGSERASSSSDGALTDEGMGRSAPAAPQEKIMLEDDEAEESRQAVDIALKAVVIPEKNGAAFNVTAQVPAGTIPSPVLVYIDVSDILSQGTMKLAEMAAQSTVSGVRALGAVGASSDGIHLLWTIVNVTGQGAILTLRTGAEDVREPWGVVVKTLTAEADGMHSNCEVNRLEVGVRPSDAQCSAKKNVTGEGIGDTMADNVDTAAEDIAVLVAVSKINERSATVSVDFHNDNSSAHIGAGGFITVDIRELIGRNVTLDEKSMPPGSSIGKDSLIIPLPAFRSVGLGRESGAVTFNVNISENSADVVLNPILVSTVLPGSEAAIPCGKFKEGSVCSIVETACLPSDRTKALTVEAKADGLKEVHAFQGATVEYSIKVENGGPRTVSTPVIVDVTDILRNAVMEAPPSDAGISLSSDKTTLRWSPSGGFQPHRTQKIRYTVRVNPDASAGEALTSKVVGTPDSQCLGKNPTDPSCEARATVLGDGGERVPGPLPGTTGIAVRTLVNGYNRAIHVQPGQQLRYSVELINTSDHEVKGVKLTQNLEEIMPYVHLTGIMPQEFVKSPAEDVLIWDEATIPAGETVVFGYRAVVKILADDSKLWNKQLTARSVAELSTAGGRMEEDLIMYEKPADGKEEDLPTNCPTSGASDPNCVSKIILAEPGGDIGGKTDKPDGPVAQVPEDGLKAKEEI